MENQQRGTYTNNYNTNPELHSGRFAPNRRSFHSYPEVPPDTEINPQIPDPYSREYGPGNPSRHSQVTFEDSCPFQADSRRLRRNDYNRFPPDPVRACEREDFNPFKSNAHSRQTSTSFPRIHLDSEDLSLHHSDYPSSRFPSPSSSIHAYEIKRKWNIKFSGSRTDDPDAFLTRIEEGRELVPVSDMNLLRVIPFFLSGIALNWYRGSKHLWRTFNQFDRAFRVRFGGSDFQFELRQEIHQRTQGERESVSDFLTCMRTMFDKFIPPMSEAEEISYAHRNLLSRLHLAIKRNEIDDSTHLEYLANAAQKSYRVARSYKPPTSPEHSLLPDLAYKDPKSRKTNRPFNTKTERLTLLEKEEELPPNEDHKDQAYLARDNDIKKRSRDKPKDNPKTKLTVPPPTDTPSPSAHSTPNKNYNPNFKCWNCLELGHGFSVCKETRNRFCYGCGKRDVIKTECPNCSGN